MKPIMPSWLTPTILSFGFVSFFTDISHECVTALLPTLMLSLGYSAATLGFIEGISNASISFMKLFSGWYSDRIGKRKIFIVVGYVLNAIGIGMFSFAYSWRTILASRLTSWLGTGIREPARDALLVELTMPRFYNRVFGFHRAMDSAGAILGPVLAYLLFNRIQLHTIFLVALIPAIIAVVIVVFVIYEPQELIEQKLPIIASLRILPKNFLLFLSAVACFAGGNYAASLLVLRALDLLHEMQLTMTTASSISIALYTLYNITYASCSLPMGYLADIFGNRHILVLGYFIMGCVSLGIIFIHHSIVMIALLFVLAGLSIAITDALERSIVADLLPVDLHGTGYGSLALVRGVGAFVSSSMVGFLWSHVSVAAGFGYSALLCCVGALILILVTQRGAFR